jgi:flagellar basal body-associated protein FliL
MKKIIILVFALLIAGGGAFFFLGNKEAPDPEAEEKAAKEEKFAFEEHHYMKLDAITVTLFRDGEVAGLYTAALTLELAQADQRSVVAAAESRLRDAMVRELHALVERRRSADIPLDAVKQHLRAIALRELGPEVVVDLFVENVLRKDS